MNICVEGGPDGVNWILASCMLWVCGCDKFHTFLTEYVVVNFLT